MPTAARRLAVLALAAGASACGGGGGGGAPAPAPGPGGGNGWTPGVFLASSTFADQCAAPRLGNDPNTGLPYPDGPGTVVTENNWLRSWSNEFYLWYDEIVDVNPSQYTTANYFDQLRTFATTPSGADKDKFHFTVPTDEWEQFSQSGVTAGYGVQWVSVSQTPPRELLVAFTEPNSPAATAPANLARGASVLMIDGVDLVNANDAASIDTLNAGLGPAGPGETHSFTVRDAGSSSTRTFSMTSAQITTDPVQNVAVIPTSQPNVSVGYMLFNDHIATAEQELIDAFSYLQGQNISDLVLDIRYNGGGFLYIASQLAYMIAGPVPTAGRTFERLEFNAKYPSTNPITGQPLDPVPFFDTTTGGAALPSLQLPRVYVLTGSGTCSASESIINSLRGVDVEVIQIGSTTCGKPYGFYPAGNCGTTYFSIQFRGVNEKGFGDYGDGFSPANSLGTSSTPVPGCSVADDYTQQLGDPAEGRLAAALNYRDTGVCPQPSGVGPSSLLSKPAFAGPPDGQLLRPPWAELRIVEY
jgi:C-terminal processing protease CtpA/Prc